MAIAKGSNCLFTKKLKPQAREIKKIVITDCHLGPARIQNSCEPNIFYWLDFSFVYLSRKS